jgi:glutaredoxin
MFDLYTRDNCLYCGILKNLLDKHEFLYRELNVQQDKEHLKFIVDQGHRTVPQLYYLGYHVNKVSTEFIDKRYLNTRMEKISVENEAANPVDVS